LLTFSLSFVAYAFNSLAPIGSNCLHSLGACKTL
jgi:hypothetical protein